MLDANGEKWACEACIKGHRVSTCTHKDRKLHHINKKGRPVSQCQHCRRFRKSHSAHVKCDCGEHSHAKDCKHDQVYTEDGDNCNCVHGSRCTCVSKKEILDLDDVPKISRPSHRRTQSKPNVPTQRSENSVPRPRNNLHPPIHRSNHAAHECGLPYTIPGPVSGSGRSGFLAPRPSDPLCLSIPPAAPMSQSQILSFSSSMPDERPFARVGNDSPSRYLRFPVDAKTSPRELDIAFWNSALSPGNPTRYSMNDFSQFNNIDFSISQHDDRVSNSANIEQPPFAWTGLETSTAHNSVPSQNPYLTPVVSADLSQTSQPGLSQSSSGTVSEHGDYVANPDQPDFSNLPNTPITTMDSLWTAADYKGAVTYNLDTPPFHEVYPDMGINLEDITALDFDNNFVDSGTIAAPYQTKLPDAPPSVGPLPEDLFSQNNFPNGYFDLAPADEEYAAWDPNFANGDWV